MNARGTVLALGTGVRKGMVLFATLLLLGTMLLQYVVAATPALAVHNTDLFELDGNTANDPAVLGDDWDSHPGATGNRTLFITDPLSQASDQIYTGGSTKDDLDLPGWRWTTGSVPDKDNIEHAFANSYDKNGSNYVYFGLDRYANNGDAFVGFWFFKGKFGQNSDGTFSGTHQVGDLLVLSNFTNGGSVSTIDLYEWVGTGGNTNGTLERLAPTGNACTGSPALDIACGVANTEAITPSWSFDDKFTSGTSNPIPIGSFFEGGINLTELFDGKNACFSSFLAETRASQQVDAVLKDYALGSFDTCAPPTITTASSASSVDFGGSVTDAATLQGSDGPASGSVKFFLCGPDASPDCSTGGSQVGGAVAVTTSSNGGTATSAAYDVGVTAAAAGKYCWRAEYTPDASSQYLAGSHTNTDTECFTVAPATISITKTASPAGPVNAGDVIGFDIKVENKGTQTTLGIHVTDPLPANISWTADAPTGATTGLQCGITTGTLDCTKPSLAAGASFTVHVHGIAAAVSCGTVDNTASVGTSNDGSDSSKASVVVNCPDTKVTKTPDGASINAGDTATFTIKVENIGTGTATGVTASDSLPAGQHWTENETDCSISGADGSQVLTCNVGTLAPSAFKTYSVSAVTDATDCGPINNTASAAATNEPSDKLANNSDTGSITVLCAAIHIAKAADHPTVNAGDPIGFTVTVSNTGTGTAYGVSATDTLDTAFTWTLGAHDTGWTLVGNALSYSVSTLAAGNSASAHVTAGTTAEDCRVVDNHASVTTTNDGLDSASASTEILCPDVHVKKTGNGTINAGDTASFDIVVSNDGAGIARHVTLSDPLPAGIAWTTSTEGCSVAAGVLSCSFGDMAPKASVTVTVSGPTTPAVCGSLVNTASAAATNESGVDAQDNTGGDTITVNCPDLKVEKSASPSAISAGDAASFTITVSNLGPGTAYAVTVHDSIPGSGTWTTGTPGCSITSNVLSCSFASLAAGAHKDILLTNAATSSSDCPSLHNVVTVGASNEAQDSETLANNSASADLTVNCPDIHVKKTGNGTISAGDMASFDIVVSNDGAGTARGVTLNDPLPHGVSWTTLSAGCSVVAGVLTCDLGDIKAGDSVTVTVSGETTAAVCGTLPNTASADATNETAADAEDNTGSDTITVNCPTIVITKTADAPSVNATDPIGFVIQVTNTGEGSAYGITVNDTLPVNAGLGWSIDQAHSDSGWSIVGGVLTYGPATLLSKASVSVHIVSGTIPATCGTVHNTASVTYQGGSGDDDSTVAVLCPDVTISKTADNSPILAGQTASYTITASNPGDGAAYGVTIKDTLPAGIAWTENSEHCSIAAGVLTCDVGTLAKGAHFSVTVSGPTTVASCGALPNTASVAATNEASADTDNNQASASITVQCASIGLVKTAGTAPDGSPLLLAAPGDVVFTYVVTNKGTAALKNLVLVDDNATPANPADDVTVTCPKDTLAAGESMTCFATLPVGVGQRTNIATVTANPVLGPEGKVSATDDAVVLVPAPEITPSPTPTTGPSGSVESLTLPPTSTLDGESGSTTGSGLFLILLIIGAVMLTAGYLIPAPARARRRNRRS